MKTAEKMTNNHHVTNNTTSEKIKNFSRIWHRRLGVVMGIQFLFWTVGGAYFAWFHIDDVRGQIDKTTVEQRLIAKDQNYYSISALLKTSKLNSIQSVALDTWNNVPVYLLKESQDKVEMYAADSGQKLSPINTDMAKKIAEQDFSPDAAIIKVEKITQRGGEYQGALPAYRIDFDNLKATHIYVHANTGVVTARRNSIWRGFDFMWMLHILDFENREDFNNWLLKLMSILSVLTILLGYSLWATTTPLFKKNESP